MSEAAMDGGMRRTLFLRCFFIQSLWSFENMQGLGFGFCLEPWLRRCYAGSPERLRQAMARHVEFFNTQPYMSGLTVGMSAALEGKIAAAPDAERLTLEKLLRGLKPAASGALAAIGDSFFWGAWRPFCVALALAAGAVAWAGGVRLEIVSAVSAAMYLLAFNVPAVGLRWWGLGKGFEAGGRIAAALESLQWQRRVRIIRLVGLGVTLGCAICGLFSIMMASWAHGGAGLAAFAVGWAARAYGYGSRKLYAAFCALGFIVAAAGWRW